MLNLDESSTCCARSLSVPLALALLKGDKEVVEIPSPVDALEVFPPKSKRRLLIHVGLRPVRTLIFVIFVRHLPH